MTQPPHLNAHLAQVPNSIRQNLKTNLSPLIANRARSLLYLDPVLTTNLWARGTFSDLQLLGVLNKDLSSYRGELPGLNVYTHNQLEHLAPDAVIVSDYRFHREISQELSPLSKKFGFQIIDLCDGFEDISFRKEWAESMARHIYANELPGWPTRQVNISVPSQWGLGDKLCALSTAREIARRHTKLKVQFEWFPEIVTAYGDTLVEPGRGGYVVPCNDHYFYRDRKRSLAANYLGCYYLNAGLHFDVPPCLDLPTLPPCPDLEPSSYIALQPNSGWAKPNISERHLEFIVQMAPLPVVVVGRPETPRDIKGANFDHLGAPIEMLRIIQHAAILLTPRSASAHIGAAYEVPSLIWVPNDGENWHLDYPGWKHKTISVRNPGLADWVVKEMTSLKNDAERASATARSLKKRIGK
jgi:hypothetical protein